MTNGNEEGGRKAMENLLQKDPGINVVHTINEPAAAGAYEALKAVGMEKDVLIVSVDGGCPGVKNVAEGVIGATSQQYPLLMASLGIEAIKKFADGRREAEADRRQGLLRHRRHAGHRQAGRRASKSIDTKDRHRASAGADLAPDLAVGRDFESSLVPIQESGEGICSHQHIRSLATSST